MVEPELRKYISDETSRVIELDDEFADGTYRTNREILLALIDGSTTMAEPKTELDHRLDRIEEAILFVADKAVYFEDQRKVAAILEKENDSELRPDSER